MSVVTWGLGLPEQGSLVAQGLGLSELNLNAMTAHLVGSGSLFGELTGPSGIESTYLFVTPTVSFRDNVRRETYWVSHQGGVSLLKLDGSWVARKNPIQTTVSQLVEGVTYFMGGRTYSAVPQSVKDDLVASGLVSEESFA